MVTSIAMPSLGLRARAKGEGALTLPTPGLPTGPPVIALGVPSFRLFPSFSSREEGLGRCRRSSAARVTPSAPRRSFHHMADTGGARAHLGTSAARAPGCSCARELEKTIPPAQIGEATIGPDVSNVATSDSIHCGVVAWVSELVVRVAFAEFDS